LRADNLAADTSSRAITLKPGAQQTIGWRATPSAPDAPWVAVVIPDNHLAQRQELTGK
jgi:hypothetical protein